MLGGGYSYDDRYFLDFNVQTSASSLYGNDNRWATGWSVGVGWNLHNEHFSHGRIWFVNLKFGVRSD